MHLTHISLTNFRNFARLDVDVPGGPIILVGGNAQGKTSLVEAIYYLATFVSFQATHERQLINFHTNHDGIAVARIVAEFISTQAPMKPSLVDSGKHRIEVRIIRETGEFGEATRLRKEIILDGVKRKFGEVVGKFNAVLFLPHMLNVVEGAPDERRRYLNLAMGQVIPKYAMILSEYGQALSQRNALLKQLGERGGDIDQLSYWDKQLANLGAQIIHTRILTIQGLERHASLIHRELTRGEEVLRILYQPSFDPLSNNHPQYALPLNAPIDRTRISLETIQKGFLNCLERLYNDEIERGVTTIGPHRDELRFLSNGVDLGTFGSRGQARTAVLSLKLAEMNWMKENSGQWPVLLLDEVLAELDPSRRSDLLERLSGGEQTLLTTTDLDLFNEHFLNHARLWHIREGHLCADSI